MSFLMEGDLSRVGPRARHGEGESEGGRGSMEARPACCCPPPGADVHADLMS